MNVDGLWFFTIDLESLFLISPRYESWIWNYLKLQPGDVFIDVGAHIGKYAIKASKMIGEHGRVIAIEPVPQIFKSLLYAIKLNGVKNITALNVAAWNREERLHMYVGLPNKKQSPAGLLGYGGSSIKRRVGPKIEVRGMHIDKIVEELKLDRVDWIKIDVEGAEYEVLEGSANTLERFRPNLIVECTENVENILELMKRIGYSIKKIAPNYFYFKPI